MATSGDGCDGERADRPAQGGDHRRVPPPRRDRRPVGRLIYSSYAAPRIEQIELRGVRGNGALLRALSSGTTGTRTHLLLVLPSGRKYDYRCTVCGHTVGSKTDDDIGAFAMPRL